MLTTLEITIQPDEDTKINQHFGSLMHGVLMQKINTDYAEELHKNTLKPFSQFVYMDRNTKDIIWKINTLNEEAKKQIIDVLINDNDNKIVIEQKNLELKITEKTLKPSVTYKEFSQDYFLTKPYKKKVPVIFITPTTFKSNGDYVIFPEIHNIYTSLLNKWKSFAEEISLEDKDVADHLISHTKIIGYKLKSNKFGLEQVRINSFTGEICLYISGPETLTRIGCLLLAFGEYAGIGAKTALGMGGIRIE